MKQSSVMSNKDYVQEKPEVDRNGILSILDKHTNDRGGLIGILEEIQAQCGYLPEEALRVVSDRTGRSLVDIYGVATFYRSLSVHVLAQPAMFEALRGLSMSWSGSSASKPAKRLRIKNSHWRR
jgi:hypothetical protein